MTPRRATTPRDTAAATTPGGATPVLDLLDVLDALGEGAFLVDGTRLVAANDAYLALTGYSMAELQALPNLLALVAPDELPRVTERSLQRGLDVPRSEEYETVLVHKS